MRKKFLVPYDGSESAKHALAEALELAQATPDGHVTVIQVKEKTEDEAFRVAARMASVTPDVVESTLVEDVKEGAWKKLREEVGALINGNEDRIWVDVVGGRPHDSITNYANSHDIDCIVMGHRGMSTMRAVLGSVCYSVIAKAHVPIYIVK